MSELCTPLYAADGVYCLLCGASSGAEADEMCLFEEVDEDVEEDQ